MGELSRAWDAVVTAIQHDESGDTIEAARMAYADALRASGQHGVSTALGAVVEELDQAGDHHGAAVARLCYERAYQVLHDE